MSLDMETVRPGTFASFATSFPFLMPTRTSGSRASARGGSSPQSQRPGRNAGPLFLEQSEAWAKSHSFVAVMERGLCPADERIAQTRYLSPRVADKAG